MHNQARHSNIPTPTELAVNLIGSLGGLTAIEGPELRRQVVMLINHSYALGYVDGAGVGLVARMRSMLALARRRAGHDIKLALSAIRERLAMIFRDHGPRSHQMFQPTFVIQYPMRGSAITDPVPIKCFHVNTRRAPHGGNDVITEAIPVRYFRQRPIRGQCSQQLQRRLRVVARV
jgi:hypothetical protein